MDWYLAVLRKYSRFRGRSRRKEYWMFVLFHFLAIVLLVAIDSFLFSRSVTPIFPLTWLYLLGTFVPSLAVSVRRLHDIGKSGWWYLITVIPTIGTLVLIIFCLLDSEAGTNQYGANPKNETKTL